MTSIAAFVGRVRAAMRYPKPKAAKVSAVLQGIEGGGVLVLAIEIYTPTPTARTG